MVNLTKKSGQWLMSLVKAFADRIHQVFGALAQAGQSAKEINKPRVGQEVCVRYRQVLSAFTKRKDPEDLFNNYCSCHKW